MERVGMVVVAYLLGSIPFAYIFVRLAGRGDVRRVGSGNVGATNAMRAAGWRWALLVAILDVGKGVLAVTLMRQITANPAWVAAAAVAAMVGHCYPVWLRFEGGKGVATAGGAFGTIALAPILATAGIWLVLLAISRIVSLASVIAAAGFPVAFYFLVHPSPALELGAVAAALVIIFRHRTNMARLLRGEEPRLGGQGERR